MVVLDTRPKIVVMPSASQISGSSWAIRCDRFLCECIKFAGMRITFNGRVKLIGDERFEPGTKSGQLLGRQLLDRLFKVFGCSHSLDITPVGTSKRP